MTDDPAASTEHAPATPESTPTTADRPPATLDRSADLVLAGVHLRLGSLALARAELETLAGRDALDPEGILDLAEARWRTGDVEGAGEAAGLVLEDEDGPLVALIVAAEAAAADGSIDRIFAGMPRSPAWPPDPAAPPPAPTTMFDPPHGLASDRARQGHRQPPRRGPATAEPMRSGPEPVAAETLPPDPTIGLWGDASEIHAPTDAVLPSASESLDRGRAAIESGDLVEASVQLALVLRLSTPLAPAVLDLVADRAEPELAFVCGDAYRLVGRELDARRAYARAAGVPQEGEPA